MMTRNPARHQVAIKEANEQKAEADKAAKSLQLELQIKEQQEQVTKRHLSSLEKEVENWKNRHADVDVNHQLVEQQLSAKENELEALQSRESGLNHELQRIQDEKDNILLRTQSLVADLSEAKDALKEQLEQRQQSNMQVREQAQQIEELKRQVAALELQAESAEKQAQALKQAIDEGDLKLKTAEKERDASVSRQEILLADSAATQSRLTQAETDLQAQAKELESMSVRVEELVLQLECEAKGRRELESEQEELTAKAAASAQLVEQLQISMTSLKEQAAQQRQSLEDHFLSEVRQKNRIVELENEINHWKEDAETYKKQGARESLNAREASDERDDLFLRLEAQTTRCDKITQELDGVSAQLEQAHAREVDVSSDYFENGARDSFSQAGLVF